MANNMKKVGALYSELPENIRPSLEIKDPPAYLKKFLRQYIPKNDIRNLDDTLKRARVPLSTVKNARKKKPHRPRRKRGLTHKEKFKLGLLKLPKTGWNYNDLESMRQMWLGYIRETVDWTKYAPEVTNSEFSNFGTILNKAEYIGAQMVIVRSTVPSLVGKCGTIVMETKNTLQIVTPESKLKTILKEHIVFKVIIDKIALIIFGKTMVNRPSERSIKKIKANLIPDL